MERRWRAALTYFYHGHCRCDVVRGCLSVAVVLFNIHFEGVGVLHNEVS